MQQTMNRETVQRILDSALKESDASTRERLVTDRWSDTNDEAQWSEDAAVALGELDIAWTKKQQARAALERLREGRYGECETCGQPIGEARLVALPWATQCVRCATIREHVSGGGQDQPGRALRDWLDDVSDAA